MRDFERAGRGVALLLLAAVANCSEVPPAEGVIRHRLILRRPIEKLRPEVVAGPPLHPIHFGTRYPARAAIRVGDETWIATPDGVLRFGADLWRSPRRARPRSVIDVAAGLPANAVNDLYAISPSEVLIATDAGLARVGRDGSIAGPSRLAGRRVTAISRELLGTWNGLYRRKTLGLVAGGASLAVTALLDCGGSAFVGTHRRGLWRIDRGGLRPVSGLTAGRVSQLACGRRGRVWAATISGLFRVDRWSARPAGSWRRQVTAVTAVGADVLFGTFGEGLHRLRDGRNTVVTAEGHVSLIERGPRDTLLVGGEASLEVIAAEGRRRPVTLPGPPGGPVTALAVDRSELWIGTFDRGLHRFDGSRFVRCPVFDRRITALVLDRSGGLWVGTAGGLGRVERGRTVRVDDPRGWLARHISALRREGDRIWAAAHPGLVAIEAASEPTRFDYIARGLAGPTVYGVAFSEGDAWVGTDQGLTRLGPGRPPRSLTDIGGVLPDNWINDVRVAGQTVSVLTLGAGLLQIGPERTRVIGSSLMTSPGVLVALEDRVLWGTNTAGLVVTGGRRLVSYGPAQGLASATVTALAFDALNDTLWVGGTAGIDGITGASDLLAVLP